MTDDMRDLSTNKDMENTPPIKSKFLPIIGMILSLFIFFAWMLAIFLLITGSTLVKTILVLLLIYQYCFAKRSETYRSILKYLHTWDYFDKVQLITETELKENKSLFCFHPHGVMAFGVPLAVSQHPVLYDSAFLGSRALLNLPISGIFARLLGLQGVDNKNFKRLMRKGRNIMFMPGGFECATITQYNRDRIFLRCRKGFIKYALKFGYSVYPCYTFNENKTFFTFTLFEQFRLLLNKLKFPGTVFFSKYFIMPNPNVEIYIVIGKPIDFPTINEPSQDDIERYHKKYMDALVETYDRHKKDYKANSTLEII